MDIYQRTLCCHPQQQKEEEIETSGTETEANDGIVEEDEECQLEEKPIDKKALLRELDCMKRRIQKIQLRLKFLNEECPEEDCADFEVELNCSKNKEICNLQKNHHKLQCQINELVKYCRAAKDHIEDLHVLLSEKTKEIAKLEKCVSTLVHWKNTVEHEFGKSIERFEYLKHVKAEWQDVTTKLDQQKKCYAVMERAFVPKECFLQEKNSLIFAINEIKEMLKELFDYQLQRFGCLEKRLDSVTGDH